MTTETKLTPDEQDVKNLHEWAEDTCVSKFTRDQLERIGQTVLGIQVAGNSKREMVRRIKAHLEANTAADAEGDNEFLTAPPPAATNYAKEGEEQHAIRCLKCGEVAIEFKPGFNPANPIDDEGGHIVFWRWPMRFVGPPHISDNELQNRNRERPRCPSCETPLAMTAGFNAPLPRALVRIS